MVVEVKLLELSCLICPGRHLTLANVFACRVRPSSHAIMTLTIGDIIPYYNIVGEGELIMGLHFGYMHIGTHPGIDVKEF